MEVLKEKCCMGSSFEIQIFAKPQSFKPLKLTTLTIYMLIDLFKSVKNVYLLSYFLKH